MIWILKYLLRNILSWICNRKIRTDNLLYNFDKRHSVMLLLDKKTIIVINNINSGQNLFTFQWPDLKWVARPINCCNLWILGEKTWLLDCSITGDRDRIQQSFLSAKLVRINLEKFKLDDVREYDIQPITKIYIFWKS